MNSVNILTCCYIEEKKNSLKYFILARMFPSKKSYIYNLSGENYKSWILEVNPAFLEVPDKKLSLVETVLCNFSLQTVFLGGYL